jgi:hypothetical protein
MNFCRTVNTFQPLQNKILWKSNIFVAAERCSSRQIKFCLRECFPFVVISLLLAFLQRLQCMLKIVESMWTSITTSEVVPYKLVCTFIVMTEGINYEFPLCSNIWAASRQNQHNGFATSMDPDQPAYSCSLIRTHADSLSVCLLVIGSVSEQHGFWLDCADAQSCMDPCWSQTHYFGFVVTGLI